MPPPVFAVALLSGAVLCYEILLMRLFSIIHWHHFAYMMISLALLGFGVSGSFLSVAQHRVQRHFTGFFTCNAAAFGISAGGCFLLAQQLPFNTLEIFWDQQQWLWLLLTYLLLLIPFFFAANAICATFARFPQQIPRIYRYDLLGAGVGALSVIVLLSVMPETWLLKLVCLTGLLAAFSTWRECAARMQIVIALAAVLIVLMPNSWFALQLSEYKGLQQALSVPDTAIIDRRSGPLGWIRVLKSPTIPLRQAPGLSLNSSHEPPPQLGVFIDGDGLTPLTHYDGDVQTLAYLDDLTSALVYQLRVRPHVLILGAGAGADVLQATYHQAKKIVAVELNPQIIDLLQRDFPDYAGWAHLQASVTLHVGEARAFIARDQNTYDILNVSLLDSSAAASAGLYALGESYLYTTEALQAYLQRLRPGGYLSITRWMKLPPRDGLKLFATAIDALRAAGVANPGAHLLMIRGWKTTTLLIKKTPLTQADIATANAFCAQRSFDVVYYPGMRPEQANRYNQLTQAVFHQGVTKLLGANAADFLQRYKFDIRPATDDRPYFFHFFKWEILPEILRLRGQGGLPLLEWGYPLLILTLLQAIVLSVVLILAPLGVLRLRKGRTEQRPHMAPVLLYFLCIGCAFLFVEMAFIQKFILFLGHPLYAIAVVLCAFLICAGFGSGYSTRLAHIAPRAVKMAVGGVIVLSLLYLQLLPWIFSACIGLPDGGKILMTFMLIAPLAFCMGMPFPLALSRIAERRAALTPWAWGVNGCASVIGSVAATVIAIHWGFTVVLFCAMALYAMVAWMIDDCAL